MKVNNAGEDKKTIFAAMRIAWEYDREEKRFYTKEIALESGPDYKGFPMSWIPLLDLTNKERYEYDQLENILRVNEQTVNYIPKYGEPVLAENGIEITFVRKRDKLKYKYVYSDGFRRNQKQVNRLREAYLKSTVAK